VNALSVSAPDTAPIAILDTGVSGAVPEIGGRIVGAFDALAATENADDLDGHGTEVAGIAAGAPGLVQGVSPTSPVMPVRIFNRLGESSAQALVAGIRWAIARGAAVINISSAAPQADASAADIESLTRATTDAFNKGILVVASAGNDGTTKANLPAALPHVLAVGASDLAGTRAAFSNTGPWIDLVAPATSLVAPMPAAFCASGYGVANGTSFAAPAVSGAAALLAKLRPELTPQQRFDVLRTSAHDVAPSGRDDETGFGLLDVGAAMVAKAPVPESSREVDDDPYYVRGANASGHPVLLAKARTATLTGQVSPAKDPSDVYRVRLRKGDRFVASAKVTGQDSVVSLALWKPAVGDFDISNGVTKQQIVSSGGFSSTPELKMRVTKGGTYYVSVEAPDPVDSENPEAVVPASEPYRLTISRQKLATKPKRRR
jgi:subtilisin family serine protease